MPAAGVGGSTAGAPTGGTGGGATGGAGTGGTSGTGGTTGGSGASAGMSGAPQGGAGMSGAGGASTGGMSGASPGGLGGMSGTAGAMAGAAGSGMAGGGAGGGSGEMVLTSPDHEEGAVFADPYTCALEGFSGSIMPELNWTPGPPGTMSYAITFIDITLAHAMPSNMNGYHWVLYNIPATTTSLPEAFTMASSIGASQNSNFLGPCPNFGGGSANTDTYEFTLYALAEESITIMGSGTAQVANAEDLLEADNLASAKLTGTSSASPP
jgi:phosphatidylethanolamine-binding protein (PEBP) family uncharacterized protein